MKSVEAFNTTETLFVIISFLWECHIKLYEYSDTISVVGLYHFKDM